MATAFVLQMEGSDEVHALSVLAAAASGVLQHLSACTDESSAEAGVAESVPLIIVVSRQHATARSLAAVVAFMGQQSAVGPLQLPKPLWTSDGVVPRSVIAPKSHIAEVQDHQLLLALEGDMELLMEVTRTADFLQVDALLELCTAVLAIAVARQGAAAACNALNLEHVSPPVLVRMLTHMPPDQQFAGLTTHQFLRDEVCIFVLSRWLEDLRVTGNANSGPRELAYCASLMDSVGSGVPDRDPWMVRLVAEVGLHMLQHRYVPPGLDGSWLGEKLRALLAVSDGGAVEVVFLMAVVGPLGAWLSIALTQCDMTDWITPNVELFYPAAGLPDLGAIVVSVPGTTSIPDEQRRPEGPVATAQDLWDCSDDNVRRFAFHIFDGILLLIVSRGERCAWMRCTRENDRGPTRPVHLLLANPRIGTAFRSQSPSSIVICEWSGIDNSSAFRAFVGCKSLTSMDFSRCSRMREFGSSFGSGTNLTALDLGGWSVTKVGALFFAGCPSLTSVTASSYCAIESLHHNAFYDCNALTTVDFSRRCLRLRSYGDSFCYGTKVTALDLGGWSAIEFAGDCFFAYCSALTSVTASAPCALERMHDHAFFRCPSLTTIDLSGCRRLREVGDLFCGESNVTAVDMSRWTVRKVGRRFFARCRSLTSVTGGADCALEGIGDHAFEGCPSLSTIDATLLERLRANGHTGILGEARGSLEPRS